MTHTSDNVTVVNFRQDDPVTNWYSELMDANTKAIYFKGLLVKRLNWIASRVPSAEITVDNVLEFHKLNYSLWKEEVERLNALIQSYDVVNPLRLPTSE